MIDVNIQPVIKGKFRWELIDTKTGKIKDKSDGYIDNMILNGWLDGLFTDSRQEWFGWQACGLGINYLSGGRNRLGHLHEFGIGSGTTPPTRSDTGLENPLSTSPDKNSCYDKSVEPTEFPVWIERQFTFNAGNGTGTINEVATWGYKSQHNVDASSRKVLDNPIEKTSTDKLIIYYRHEFDIPQRHYSGTITGGQRDGTTDIDWNLYITDDMIYNAWAGYGDNDGSYNAIAYPFGFYSNGHVYIGDSNVASDITNDSGKDNSQLKGTELWNGDFSFIEPDSYVDGSYQMSTRVGFEENVANVQIAEMLIKTHELQTPSFRITFNPALDNVANYRLYLDLSISLGNIS
jgi:hypothetical protein